MKVKIPFKKEFREVMTNGRKVVTSRTKQMGKYGDTFEAFGKTFVILAVTKKSLGMVATLYWYEEGCDSKQEFIDVWKKIHPRKGYVPEQIVYLHRFKLLDYFK